MTVSVVDATASLWFVVWKRELASTRAPLHRAVHDMRRQDIERILAGLEIICSLKCQRMFTCLSLHLSATTSIPCAIEEQRLMRDAMNAKDNAVL